MTKGKVKKFQKHKMPVYLKDVKLSILQDASNIADPMLRTLMEMFTYCRPHESETETAFINRFLPPNPTLIDGAGNIHYDRRTSEQNKTLFVAHCDSVHYTLGYQNVFFDAQKKIIHTDGHCLGADDAAGIFMMLHMMEHGVPAYYIFTRGEECGGIGAKYLAKRHAPLLEQFQKAIAFDRKDTYSIITHQGWGRTASDEFANALADQLNNLGLMYMPDDTGVYTDTCEFSEIIPECTNLSVGYMHEHTQNEVLHLAHFKQLATAVLQVNWDNLPAARSTLDFGETDIWGYGGWSADKEINFEPTWDIEDYDVVWALDLAEQGDIDELLYMIADAAYPEDTEAALSLMDERYLDPAMVRQAKSETAHTDSLTILCRLFEKLAV